MKSLLLVIVPSLLIFFAFRFNLILGIVVSIAVFGFWGLRAYPLYLRLKSRRFLLEGKYKKARNVLKKFAENPNAKTDIKMEYAYVLMRTGQFEDAERIFNNILSGKPDNSTRGQAILQRSLCYYKQNNLDEALEDVTNLFDDGFRSTTLYGLLGYFKILTDPMSKDTFDFCLEAYDYADDDRDICDNMLICYYNRGEYYKAKEISDSILENNPKFVEAWYHAAQIDVKLNDYASANEKLGHIGECNRSFMTTVSEEEVEALQNEIIKNLEVVK